MTSTGPWAGTAAHASISGSRSGLATLSILLSAMTVGTPPDRRGQGRGVGIVEAPGVAAAAIGGVDDQQRDVAVGGGGRGLVAHEPAQRAAPGL